MDHIQTDLHFSNRCSDAQNTPYSSEAMTVSEEQLLTRTALLPETSIRGKFLEQHVDACEREQPSVSLSSRQLVVFDHNTFDQIQERSKFAIQETSQFPKIVDQVLNVPLNHSDFNHIMQGCFKTQKDGDTRVEEHAVLYKGDLRQITQETDVLVRLNSACFTGDIFGDKSCDCTWQLFAALQMIEKSPGVGIILYHLEHEGKAHGYFEKLKSFDGQMYPVDGDLRDFRPAVSILHHLNIRRVRLITNNPAKTDILTKNGINVVETVPIVSQDAAMVDFYDYKATKWGHALPRKDACNSCANSVVS